MKERFPLQTYLLTVFEVHKGMSTPAIDRLARWGRADCGNTMLFVMVLITVMVLLGGSITNRVLFESQSAFRNLHRTQAFYLAEAGIEHARYDMTGQDLSSLLKGPDGLPNTADDGTLSFGGLWRLETAVVPSSLPTTMMEMATPLTTVMGGLTSLRPEMSLGHRIRLLSASPQAAGITLPMPSPSERI